LAAKSHHTRAAFSIKVVDSRLDETSEPKHYGTGFSLDTDRTEEYISNLDIYVMSLLSVGKIYRWLKTAGYSTLSINPDTFFYEDVADVFCDLYELVTYNHIYCEIRDKYNLYESAQLMLHGTFSSKESESTPLFRKEIIRSQLWLKAMSRVKTIAESEDYTVGIIYDDDEEIRDVSLQTILGCLAKDIHPGLSVYTEFDELKCFEVNVKFPELLDFDNVKKEFRAEWNRDYMFINPVASKNRAKDVEALLNDLSSAVANEDETEVLLEIWRSFVNSETGKLDTDKPKALVCMYVIVERLLLELAQNLQVSNYERLSTFELSLTVMGIPSYKKFITMDFGNLTESEKVFNIVETLLPMVSELFSEIPPASVFKDIIWSQFPESAVLKNFFTVIVNSLKNFYDAIHHARNYTLGLVQQALLPPVTDEKIIRTLTQNCGGYVGYSKNFQIRMDELKLVKDLSTGYCKSRDTGLYYNKSWNNLVWYLHGNGVWIADSETAKLFDRKGEKEFRSSQHLEISNNTNALLGLINKGEKSSVVSIAGNSKNLLITGDTE